MRLARIHHASLIVNALEPALRAYASDLRMQVQDRTPVSETEALAMGAQHLAGAACAWLSCGPSTRLRLIEDRAAQPTTPFARYGWMALEIAVDDVDALARRLDPALWQILGEPRDLDVSDAIRAMQVAGPNGEVLYLTEVKRAVPPFELPLGTQGIGELFVAVLAARSRTQSLGFYAGLGWRADWRFDTRLSAFNARHGLADAARHPVGVGQLLAEHLIEIDQPSGVALAPCDPRATGIRSISFVRGSTAAAAPGSTSRWLSGPDGEAIGLLG